MFLFGRASVDLAQMDTSLGVTWVQGYGGSDTSHYVIDSGLSLISRRYSLSVISRAQRLVYQAEDTWPRVLADYVYAFFGTKETGQRDGDSWVCNVNRHPPGYMVRKPRPDNRFYHDQKQHYAIFRMKIRKEGEPDGEVVLLSVKCYTHGGTTLGTRTLKDSDFAESDVYHDFEVPFSLEVDCSPPCEKACDSVDVQVYWYGNRTTWLDYVIVEDEAAKSLFGGKHDATIEAEARNCLANPRFDRVQRFYLTDEPSVRAFLPFKYIDDKLRSLGFTGSRGRAITSNNWTDSWIRWFIRAARPNEVLVHYYVLDSSIPSPPMEDMMARSVGVAPYVGDNQYNDILQPRLDIFEKKLGPAAVYSKEAGISLWSTTQLHGEYIVRTGQFNHLNRLPARRPPTGPELRVQVSLALAFGAKGIIGYPYGTDYLPSFAGSEAWMTGLVSRSAESDGIQRDHSTNVTTLPGPDGKEKSVYAGYQEKWVALSAINEKLRALRTLLVTLNWQGAKSWYSEVVYGTWDDIVDEVTARSPSGDKDDPVAITVGHLKDSSGVDYLIVVNRRCDNTNAVDTRDIHLKFDFRGTGMLIIDVETNAKWMLSSTGTLVDRFEPGEGKVFRVEEIH